MLGEAGVVLEIGGGVPGEGTNGGVPGKEADGGVPGEGIDGGVLGLGVAGSINEGREQGDGGTLSVTADRELGAGVSESINGGRRPTAGPVVSGKQTAQFHLGSQSW